MRKGIVSLLAAGAPGDGAPDGAESPVPGGDHSTAAGADPSFDAEAAADRLATVVERTVDD